MIKPSCINVRPCQIRLLKDGQKTVTFIGLQPFWKTNYIVVATTYSLLFDTQYKSLEMFDTLEEAEDFALVTSKDYVWAPYDREKHYVPASGWTPEL